MSWLGQSVAIIGSGGGMIADLLERPQIISELLILYCINKTMGKCWLKWMNSLRL